MEGRRSETGGREPVTGLKFSRRDFAVVAAVALNSCRQPRESVLAATGTYNAFHTPENVTIAGYTGDAMEPFLTRDGRYLLFNNRNEAPENTNVHWAARVDDTTFRYRGEILGVNTDALEGVPSMDTDGNLYFVSTRSYPQSFSTLYRARFQDGAATQLELLEGVSRKTPGWVNFDAEISADGKKLYFVDSYFGTAGHPQNANIVIAVRSGTAFRRLADSDRVLANVNSDALEYAPSTSADELELYFTRVRPGDSSAGPGILRATRPSLGQPFAIPQRVSAIQGFAEAPTLSPDGRSLYFHARVDGRLLIRRVTR